MGRISLPINWQDVGVTLADEGHVDGPYGDNYYFERTQIDAQASYYLGKGFTITASEENTNNAILGFYNGSKQSHDAARVLQANLLRWIRWSLGQRKVKADKPAGRR